MTEKFEQEERRAELAKLEGHGAEALTARAVRVGWLHKQGGRIKTWKKRYFTVYDHSLWYFKSEKDEYPTGQIELVGVAVEVDVECGRANAFRIYRPAMEMSSNHASYVLQADSESLRDEWIAVVKANKLQARRTNRPASTSSIGSTGAREAAKAATGPRRRNRSGRTRPGSTNSISTQGSMGSRSSFRGSVRRRKQREAAEAASTGGRGARTMLATPMPAAMTGTVAPKPRVPEDPFVLSKHDWIGFDVDHTLVRYHLPAYEELIFQCVVQYLVRRKHYPASLLDESYPSSLAMKGLVVDNITGNLLKLNAAQRVCRASHGVSQLSQAEIAAAYGTKVIDFRRDARYHVLVSFQQRPLGPLYSLLVALRPKDNPRQLFRDMMEGMSFNLRSTPSRRAEAAAPGKPGAAAAVDDRPDIAAGEERADASGEDDWFLDRLHRDRHLYVYRRPSVRRWLEEAVSAKRNLFVLTNANVDHTYAMMDHALGPGWDSLFSVIITSAGKPGWFGDKKEAPLYHVARQGTDLAVPPGPDGKPAKASELSLRGTYSKGHAKLFDQLSRPLLHAETREALSPDKPLHVCYVGDHIIGDVFAPRELMNWSTVCVLEELFVYQHARRAEGTDHLDAPAAARRTGSTSSRRSERPYLQSNFWGNWFTEKAEPTFWVNALGNAGTVVVPSVSTSALLGWDHRFLFDDNYAPMYIDKQVLKFMRSDAEKDAMAPIVPGQEQETGCLVM